jgi:hypothetical protein
LFTSPIYNGDGYIGVRNNRFKAWHLALAGDLADGLHYRAKLTWEKGWGTYDKPFYQPKITTSMLVEATYSFPKLSVMNGFSVTLAYGSDSGDLLGDNSGMQATVRYQIK